MKWSITTDLQLFNPKGNHIHEGDEIEQDEDIDVDQVGIEA